MRLRHLLLLLACTASSICLKAQEAPYKNESLSAEERATDLLKRLTAEEKISLLTETSPGIPRLGIPKYYHGNEALHGVVRPGNFTVFPQAIALAASWDPQMLHTVATAISDEARGRWNALGQGADQNDRYSDLLTFWSPTINMARDPRWGRTPETYGEDPFLTGTMGCAFVRGLQGDDPKYLKVVSTLKHFAANNEEHNRANCNAVISEKDLREYYLAPFEMCVKEADVQAVMTAYNAINGIPCTVNPWLISKVLRGEWGFDGYVVSDCGAPNLVVTSHNFVSRRETSATLAIKAGLDLECGDLVFKDYLKEAYRQGMVSDDDLDKAAFHILRARMRLGLFDDPSLNPYNSISEDVVGCKKHQDLALQAAREGLVLLKNDRATLPLKLSKLKSIAVVGNNADKCVFGDYSGIPVIDPVSPLEGIRRRVGDKVKLVSIPWKQGESEASIISGKHFPNGLKAEYFEGTKFSGEARSRIENEVNYDPAGRPPDPFIPKGSISVRWSGTLVPDISGLYTLQAKSDDGIRVYIDSRLLIDHFDIHPATIDDVQIPLEGGKAYSITVEYYDAGGEAVAQLLWSVPENKEDMLARYRETYGAVKGCDAVVAVMGTDLSVEREAKDRTSISLPAGQRDFLEALKAINPNVILVLVSGSSLALGWESEEIPAILDVWYPGESGGTAVAEAIFGDFNPAGRLPLTFYADMSDLPPFDDYNVDKGRTYKYFTGKPVYPFGHGLSYTSFKYSKLNVADAGDSIRVSFLLKNSGGRSGDEVAQLYVTLPNVEGVALPQKELKAFSRVSLSKGEAKTVQLIVPKASLRYWDSEEGCFKTPSGTYTIRVGASSEDIRLQGEISL